MRRVSSRGSALDNIEGLLTWLQSVAQNLIDGINRLIFWCVQDDDQRANEAERATRDTYPAESLAQEERSQDGTTRRDAAGFMGSKTVTDERGALVVCNSPIGLP